MIIVADKNIRNNNNITCTAGVSDASARIVYYYYGDVVLVLEHRKNNHYCYYPSVVSAVRVAYEADLTGTMIYLLAASCTY